MKEQEFDFLGVEKQCGDSFSHPPHKIGDFKKHDKPYEKFCCGVAGMTVCGKLTIDVKVREFEDRQENFLKYKGIWWIDDA